MLPSLPMSSTRSSPRDTGGRPRTPHTRRRVRWKMVFPPSAALGCRATCSAARSCCGHLGNVAELNVVDFVFDIVGTHRLEARAAVANGRGNGALKKLGAVQEGVLRKSLFRHGLYLDQILWAILEEDWRLARSGRSPRVH